VDCGINRYQGIAGIPEFKNFEFFISKKENNHHKMEVDDVSMMASDALSR